MATIKAPSSPDGAGTVIGDSVHVKGSLTGDEDLHVLGKVEGRVELQRTLVVAESGVVKAEVVVRNAIVSGVVVGNIRAHDSVEITKEGRMVGDIHAPRVIIVDGASFRGNVDMGDIENMPVRKPSADRPRPVVSSPPAASAAPRPAVSVRPTVAPRPAVAPVVQRAPDEPMPERRTIPPSLEPPGAKGLPKKVQKTRVIVKRR